jgi:CRISPR-associated endonuclease Csn1
MRVVGVDGGIASIGWAVLDIDHAEMTIVAAGVRTFDAPETDKERTPTNALRRQHRGQRRVIRRRRQRMAQIRALFAEHSLVPEADTQALALGLDPWLLRAEGLDRALKGPELAVALGHIARHRGFRSNAKREHGANAADETSKMKKAIEKTRERLGQWKTVGQMFAADPDYAGRKRNRGGDFTRSMLRSDQEDEVRVLFAAQRRHGNRVASEDLQASFASLAFDQHPLADSEHMVGKCPFEPGEIRTARRSYAFEMFRLVSKLNTLSLVSGADDRRLTVEEIALVVADFGKSKGISYKSIRKTLDLHPATRFAGLPEKDESRDVAARTGAAAEGTKALRDVVGDAGWHMLMGAPVQRDRIAEILSFREDPLSIRAGLVEAGVEPLLIDAIMHGVETGKFAGFSKAGHISAKAARAILPPLLRGLVYSEACADVGYNHVDRPEVRIEDVRNPVARKAVAEMQKQIRAIVQKYGLPDFIHVELARDVGKGAEERDKITKGIEDRNKQRDKTREEFVELLHREPGRDDLLRFELWKEQNGFCLYTGDPIPPEWIVSEDNRVQVDHILPWSRFGDDSFVNKTLCMARSNQAKKGRTPFEWFEAERPGDWALFAERVERCREMKGRKKGGFYLRRNAKEVEENFRNRNLGDTRYATRLLLGLLARLYPKDGKRHVLARPGALTANLRRAWGLDALKKDAEGKRIEDDRHHALDAIVVAATSEAMLQKLTEAAKKAEQQGLARGWDFGHVQAPSGFREAVQGTIADIFVSRAERHRARGKAHAATIKQVREVDGAQVVFERKAVEKLTLADLEKIPVPEPYGRIADPAKLRDEMVRALQIWIEAGKPKDKPPLSPKGDIIRKVRVATKDKVAVLVRDGTADRGEMARVDVFAKADKRGKRQFHLVPIYPHQVANRSKYPTPPCRAVVAHKAESEWTETDKTFAFLFSLYPNSLIEVAKSDGEFYRGYFRGLDRNSAQIALSPPAMPQTLIRGIGSKTLSLFSKHSIDRLGNRSPVRSEVRTWHGEACT